MTQPEKQAEIAIDVSGFEGEYIVVRDGTMITPQVWQVNKLVGNQTSLKVTPGKNRFAIVGGVGGVDFSFDVSSDGRVTNLNPPFKYVCATVNSLKDYDELVLNTQDVTFVPSGYAGTFHTSLRPSRETIVFPSPNDPISFKAIVGLKFYFQVPSFLGGDNVAAVMNDSGVVEQPTIPLAATGGRNQLELHTTTVTIGPDDSMLVTGYPTSFHGVKKLVLVRGLKVRCLHMGGHHLECSRFFDLTPG